MRRFVPILIAGAALIAAACRDSVAPSHSRPSTTSLQLLEDLSFSRVVSSTEGAGAAEFTFTLTRAAGSAQIGEFTLSWDANSVCDPATSGYGFAYWRTSCSPAASDIEMTAKVWTDNGRVYADFSPDIRFSPDRDVTLGVNRPEIVGRRLTLALMLKYNIFYTHRIGDTRFYIDEAWLDPEQRTQFNTTTGDVWREIRHFSGFVIRTGGCDGSDPVCVSTGSP